jgi:hypothetical protein
MLSPAQMLAVLRALYGICAANVERCRTRVTVRWRTDAGAAMQDAKRTKV